MALTDESPMPFGKHKDKQMIDVPATYLLYLYEEKKYNKEVKEYIEDNMQILKKQAGRS